MGLKASSGLLNMVPYVGPVLSMAANFAGGALEAKAAQDQKAQAEKARKEALGLKPEKISKYYTDKLKADKAAALAGLPGYELAKSAIDTNIATGIRGAMEGGASGAQRLALISALSTKGNQALNDLSIKDATFKAGLQKDVRDTMADLGDEEYKQQLIRDKWKEMGLEGASALENASTYNKVNALNKILGSAATTISALGSQIPYNAGVGAATDATGAGLVEEDADMSAALGSKPDMMALAAKAANGTATAEELAMLKKLRELAKSGINTSSMIFR